MDQRVIVESDLDIFLDRLETLVNLTLETSAGAMSRETRKTLHSMTADIQILIGEVLERIKAVDKRARQLRFMSAQEQDIRKKTLITGLSKSIDASLIADNVARFLERRVATLLKKILYSYLPLLMNDRSMKAYVSQVKKTLHLLQHQQRFRPWEFGRTAP